MRRHERADTLLRWLDGPMRAYQPSHDSLSHTPCTGRVGALAMTRLESTTRAMATRAVFVTARASAGYPFVFHES